MHIVFLMYSKFIHKQKKERKNKELSNFWILGENINGKEDGLNIQMFGVNSLDNNFSFKNPMMEYFGLVFKTLSKISDKYALVNIIKTTYLPPYLWTSIYNKTMALRVFSLTQKLEHKVILHWFKEIIEII